MEPIESQANYVPLQLIPQRARFQSAAGQLAALQSGNRPQSLKQHATQSNKPIHDATTSLHAVKHVQEQYQLIDSSNEKRGDRVNGDIQQVSASASQQQRQGIRQNLAKFEQQAAAIKSAAAAVNEWFDKQEHHHAAPLPADALRVLNKEAGKGLLHLLSTGLIPPQLELLPGLSDGSDAVLQSRPAALFHSDQRHTASSRAYTAPQTATSRPTAGNRIKSTDTQAAASPSAAASQQPVAAADEALTAAALAGHAAATAAAVASQPRGYEALLDDLSEHQLLIYRGKLVQETPQMLSFLRLAVSSWHTVSVLLSQLEAVCRLFSVPLARVDGKAVLQLAADTKAQASAGATMKFGLPDLLCCLANLDELEPLFEAGSELMEKAMAASDTGAASAAAGTPAAVAAAPTADKLLEADTVMKVCQPVHQQQEHQQQVHQQQVHQQQGQQQQEQQQQEQQQQEQQQQVWPDAADTASYDAGGAVAGTASKETPSTSLSAATACIRHRLQQPLLDAMYQARCSRDAKFRQLQQQLRQQWQQWQQMQRQPHVVVHLPSMPCSQQQQQRGAASYGYELQPCQQQHQLWRMLDLVQRVPHGKAYLGAGAMPEASIRDNLSSDSKRVTADSSTSASESCTAAEVVVMVVVDRPVCKPAQMHWMQVLRGAGVKDPERHIRFVVAERGLNPPTRLPLSASLLSCEKALSRCRQILAAHSSSSMAGTGTQQSQPQQQQLQPQLPQQQAVAAGTTAAKPRQDWNYSTRCPCVGLPLPRPAELLQHVPVQPHAEQTSLLAGYIVPGCTSEYDVDVAVTLGLPLLGPTPQLAQVLTSRVGCRSLLAAAGIRVPPGGVLPRSSSSSSQEDAAAASWQQLLTAMCLQLLCWSQQHTWVLKLDHATGTTGLAVLDLQDMPKTQAARQLAVQQLQQQQPQQQQQQQQQAQYVAYLEPLDLASVQADKLQQALEQVAGELVQELNMGLLLATPQHWHQQAAQAMAEAGSGGRHGEAATKAAAAYLEALRQQGGVMEALLDSITCCPLVQLFIDPTGAVTVLATQDKILHGGFSSPGSTFPSSCPVPAALAEAASAAGKAAYTAGMLGYLQVSFLCTSSDTTTSQQQQQQAQEVQQEQQHQLPQSQALCGTQQQSVAEGLLLWGCDLVPWATADLAVFRLYDTVAQGCFKATTGKYTVSKQPDPHWQQQHQQHCRPVVQQQHGMRHASCTEDARSSEVQCDGCGATSRSSCGYASLHEPAAVLSAAQCEAVACAALSESLDAALIGSAAQPASSSTLETGNDGGVLISIDCCSSGKHRVALPERKGAAVCSANCSVVDEPGGAFASCIVCWSQVSTHDALQKLSLLLQQLDSEVS